MGWGVVRPLGLSPNHPPSTGHLCGESRLAQNHLPPGGRLSGTPATTQSPDDTPDDTDQAGRGPGLLNPGCSARIRQPDHAGRPATPLPRACPGPCSKESCCALFPFNWVNMCLQLPPDGGGRSGGGSSPRNDKQLKYGEATAKCSAVLKLPQEEKSDKKNKPSCAHISLTMCPVLWFPRLRRDECVCLPGSPRAAHGAAWDWRGPPAGPLLQSTEWGQCPEQGATDDHFPSGPLTKLLPGCGQPVCLSCSLSLAFELANPVCKLPHHPRVEEAG